MGRKKKTFKLSKAADRYSHGGKRKKKRIPAGRKKNGLQKNKGHPESII